MRYHLEERPPNGLNGAASGLSNEVCFPGDNFSSEDKDNDDIKQDSGELASIEARLAELHHLIDELKQARAKARPKKVRRVQWPPAREARVRANMLRVIAHSPAMMHAIYKQAAIFYLMRNRDKVPSSERSRVYRAASRLARLEASF